MHVIINITINIIINIIIVIVIVIRPWDELVPLRHHWCHQGTRNQGT